jgi:hypothetical protein
MVSFCQQFHWEHEKSDQRVGQSSDPNREASPGAGAVVPRHLDLPIHRARARTHTLSSFHHCSPRALQSYKFVPRDHATPRRVGTKLRDDSCELRGIAQNVSTWLPLSLVDSPHVHPGRTPRVLRTTPPQ